MSLHSAAEAVLGQSVSIAIGDAADSELRAFLRVHGRESPLVSSRDWHPSQRITELPNGSVQVAVRVPSLASRVSWFGMDTTRPCRGAVGLGRSCHDGARRGACRIHTVCARRSSRTRRPRFVKHSSQLDSRCTRRTAQGCDNSWVSPRRHWPPAPRSESTRGQAGPFERA